jgi:hypothetical protein
MGERGLVRRRSRADVLPDLPHRVIDLGCLPGRLDGEDIGADAWGELRGQPPDYAAVFFQERDRAPQLPIVGDLNAH